MVIETDASMMVTFREQEPHKLLGTSSSHLCSKILCQACKECSHPDKDGQQNSHLLCELQRRDSLSEIEAIQLWQWCLERNLTLVVEHLPGIDNCLADEESRTIHSTAEWQLHHVTFQLLMQKLSRCNLDLFATCLNAQLEKFMSWRPDPEAIRANTLQLTWTSFTCSESHRI